MIGMKNQSPFRLLPLIAFTSVFMIAAVAGAMVQGNKEFFFHIAVMLVLIGVVSRVRRAATLSTAILWAISGVSQAQDAAPPPAGSQWQLPAAIRYQSLRRTTPRLLRIHVLRIDLTSDAIAISVGIGKDPDGAGPVEALLTPPSELANGKGMCAAINTNAWTMFPDPSTGKNPGYIAGGRTDIKGWVVDDAGQRSNKEGGYWSCWMAQDGRCRMGSLDDQSAHGAEVQKPKWAVSGFRGILKDGEVLVAPSEVLHPRTAVGLSADGKWMTWIVVDGRQPGYSLGVSEEELARLLKENGCADGINLDGGGSSVLLLADRSRRLKPANQPSDHGRPRPVPVILGVKESARR
jgi:hypothetical protein